MTNEDLQSRLFQTHEPQYWPARRLAFAQIKMLEQVIAERNSAPLYVACGVDENGDYIPQENIEPFERVANVVAKIKDNPTVLEILAAQKKLNLLES